jgi:hypothetical protein
MKISSFLVFIFVIVMIVSGCSKTDVPDSNGDKDNVTDTTSNGNNNGNETTDTTSTNVPDTTIISNPDTTITNNPDPGDNGEVTDSLTPETNKKDTITLSFFYGENGPSSDYKNIYVAWMEAPGFIQNMVVCRKLIAGGLTGTALPYWKINKYPLSSNAEVDAVTSATKGNTDFTITTVIKDSTLKNLTINFETDRSFDPNDWFDNQPAILYSATINLEDTLSSYELSPIGWTPNESTENQVENTPMGKLQNEMKYITNYKKDSGFGEKDSRCATKMVKKISVLIK